MCGTDIFLGVLAVLFPPVAVWVKRGICSADSLINIALCCLGFLPGLLHAWYIIYTNPDPIDAYERVPDREQGSGHVTYYYVAHSPSLRAQGTSSRRGTNPNSNLGSQPQFPGQYPQQYQSHAAMSPKAHASQKQNPNYGSLSAAPAQQFPGQQKAGKPAPQVAGGSGEGSAEGAAPPPTYADAVAGDHKVQTQD